MFYAALDVSLSVQEAKVEGRFDMTLASGFAKCRSSEGKILSYATACEALDFQSILLIRAIGSGAGVCLRH